MYVVLGFCALFALFIVAMVGDRISTDLQKTKRLNSEFDILGKQYGGKVIPARLFWWPRFPQARFLHQHRPVIVDSCRSDHSSFVLHAYDCDRLRVHTQLPGFEFAIRTGTLASTLRRAVDLRICLSGDETFDREFSVVCPFKDACRLLTPEVMAAIKNLKTGTASPFAICRHDDELFVELAGDPCGHDLEHFVTHALATITAIQEIKPAQETKNGAEAPLSHTAKKSISIS